MALNPNTYADQYEQVVLDQAAKYETQQPIKSIQEVAEDFATIYDSYAKEGTLPGADLAAGGDISILEAGFVSDNTPATTTRMAEALCNYWVTNNTPGAPAHGGTAVQSVTITPNIPAMVAALQGLITDQPVAEPYRLLFATQQAVVSSFVCTVVELMPPNNTPTPFTESIS